MEDGAVKTSRSSSKLKISMLLEWRLQQADQMKNLNSHRKSQGIATSRGGVSLFSIYPIILQANEVWFVEEWSFQ
jgi:hypothetical protein